MQNTFVEILRSRADDRRALYATVAATLETRAENIEKDLYVCWILDFLLNQREGDPVNLYFKGGTSLSIRRFSEDIDIGVYKADIKAPLEDDIAAQTSVTKQQKMLVEKVDEAARHYISGPLREQLPRRPLAMRATFPSDMATTPIESVTRSIFLSSPIKACSAPMLTTFSRRSE